MVWSLNRCNGHKFDISQEIFSIDMLAALKSSLKHRRKHVLRCFRLYVKPGLHIVVMVVSNVANMFLTLSQQFDYHMASFTVM